MGEVRRLERLYAEKKQQVDNSAARLATYAMDDPAAAPVEHNMRMLAKELPGLVEKRDKAAAAVVKARNNTALRDDLIEWFDAWIAGWQALSRERQRQFLFALKATVRVWREEDRTPRAQLIVKLPTNSLDLPALPTDAEVTWRADIDVAMGARLAAIDENEPSLIEGVDPRTTYHAPTTREELQEAIAEERADRQRLIEEQREADQQWWYDKNGQDKPPEGSSLRSTRS